MSPAPIFTSSWAAALRESEAVAVRISVGCPKAARNAPFIGALAPFGIFGKDLTDEEFRRRYRERLDRYGVEGIRARIERVAADHPDQVLLLCCFERDRADCHRGDLANWWFEQTGEQIPEWTPTERQLSLDTKEQR